MLAVVRPQRRLFIEKRVAPLFFQIIFLVSTRPKGRYKRRKIIWNMYCLKITNIFSLLNEEGSLGTNDAKKKLKCYGKQTKNGTKSAVQSRTQHEQPNTTTDQSVCPVSLFGEQRGRFLLAVFLP